MTHWHKLGFIWKPSGELTWAREYAHLPTPEMIDSETIRVFFAALDDRKFGRIGWIDVAADDPTRIIGIGDKPVLDLGSPGTFDDSGVTPSCFVTIDGRRCLFYTGWQRCERVPYQLFTGCADSESKTELVRSSTVPVLDRCDAEPFLRSTACVLREPASYSGWYTSANGWIEVEGKAYPEYVVRKTESKDGRTWTGGGPVCIGHDSPDQFGIARPWVIRDVDIYRMWYSIRSRSAPYRIGYAESNDGLCWERMDHDVGIERGKDGGWDSEMICYPAIIDVKGKRLMFYNGNRHGASGFGCAVLEQM